MSLAEAQDFYDDLIGRSKQTRQCRAGLNDGYLGTAGDEQLAFDTEDLAERIHQLGGQLRSVSA